MESEPQRRLTKREKRLLRQQEQNASLQATPNFALQRFQPITKNQEKAFNAFRHGKHLFLHGTAGTGKTFVAFYLALNSLYNTANEYNKVYVVRSVVPTRDMGFLPGNQKEKMRVYESPYYSICTELYGRGDAYEVLKQKNAVDFMSTSFIRGVTLTDCIVIVDECQNMDHMELHSIITRAGNNCRFLFCGDFRQDDLSSERKKEKSGVRDFMNIIQRMSMFEFVDFKPEDIVRSDLVKEYIITREELGFDPL